LLGWTGIPGTTRYPQHGADTGDWTVGPAISIRSVTSAQTVRTRLSEKAFALGLRGGILTTSILAADSTASNPSVNRHPAD